MFKYKDIVTLVSGRTGEFVRYYGKRVQVRTSDGMKVTGDPVENIHVTGPESEELQLDPGDLFPVEPEKPRAVTRLGSAQQKVLDAVTKTPQISFRDLAAACGITIPQSAIVIRALCKRGVIVKTQINGRNRYDRP